MSAAPPVVLLLDDADTFKAVEGTCLRRDRCRLVKASFDDLRAAAFRSRPSLILASCADAESREKAMTLFADRTLAEVPVVLVDFGAGRGAAPRARGTRVAPVEVVTARRRRSGRPDFSDLDPRLDDAVKRLLPQIDRRTRRLAVSLPVRCAGAGLPPVVRTKDISASGLFLKTDAPVAAGRRFDVTLRLAPGRSITGTCEVVRRVLHGAGARDADRDLIPGIGVRFVNLAEEGREALRAFVFSQGAPRAPRRAPTRPSH